MQQLAVFVEYKEMRVPIYLRVLREHFLVFIFRAHIHLYDDVTLVKNPCRFLVGLEELFELMTPTSPIAADI